MKHIFTLILSTIFVASTSFAQYCSPTSAGGTGTFMNEVSFGGMINNSVATNPTASPYYMSYSNTANVSPGATYSLTVTMGPAGTYTAAIASVWIDYNQNSTFEATEWQQIGTAIPSGAPTTISITIPVTATPGSTKMRLRTRGNGNINGAGDACTNFGSGESEDYNVTIIPAVACSGTPTAGTAISSATSICPATPFNLSLSGATLASGLTYQWQSSPDGITFTSIPGATAPTYSSTQSSNTTYWCIIACTASGLSDTSTSVAISTNSFLNCYCASNATSLADEEILNVSIGTMNNTSTCTTTGGAGSLLNQYSNYTATVTPPILAASASYPFSVQVGTCGGNFNSMIKIYIDYNQNGSFTDPGEQVYVSPASINGPYIATGSILIPPTATVGLTRMRIVNVETSSAASINPCGTYTYGETEDYFVNIAPVPTCPQPTALSLVTADLTNATLQWTAGGAETSWQIEYGIQGFTPGTGTTVITSSNPHTLSGLTTSSFYQAYVRGICGPGDTSYWAGTISWNTYGQAQYMEWDNSCPTSNFVDITAGGTNLNLLEDASAGVTLPFPLLYQGTLINQISIGNNGGIVLGSLTANVNYTMVAGNGLYPYVQDMNAAYDGVYYQTIGTAPNRQFIVMWSDLAHYISSALTDGVTFEVIIDEATQEIYYVYEDVNHDNPLYNNGLDAEIGVRGPNQNINVSMNNATYLTNNSCAHFYYTDCPKPTGFTISYVTADEVAFTWTAGLAAETNWTVIYGPDGFDPATGGTTITTTTAAATLPGLTQLTQYDVYIFADCNTTLQSNGLSGTFLTLPLCSNPGGMTNTTDIDSIYTAWTWTESSPAYPSTGFNIAYGMSGFNPYTQGTEVNADNNLTDTIANPALLAGGVYQVYVQAVCGTDTSQYIGPFAVTMPLSNDTVCGAEMLMADGTVYTFNNTGATVQTGETAIAPPATGAQTTTGWINSSLNNTTWFKFVAPASGNVRVNNTAINYAGQAAVYDASSCSDFATFSLVAANDNAIGGTSVAPNFTVCGLTPGVEYYLMNDGSTATVGNYSISITPIVLNAGSFTNIIDVCAGDTVNLFNGITGQDAGGVWTAELASAGTGITDSLFASAGLAFQIFNFEYRLTDGCAYDSIVTQVDIYGPSSAGQDGTLTVCRNEPIDLLAGLSGNVDFGGSWYNPSNQLMASSEIIASNIPGQFNYDYITGNGVCPDDTANVLLNVDPSCNYLDVTEMYFGSISMYPNPTNGMVYITNSGSTEVFNYQVTDVEGRVIATKIAAINGAASTEVNLSGKETGIYMIRVYNDNAEKVFRVVLQ